MDDDLSSVSRALDAADRGELGQWVREFLSSPGSDNAELAEELQSKHEAWLGPLPLPFDELHRLAGPSDQPTLAPLSEDDLDTVEEMEDSIDEDWRPPPLIVSYRNRRLVLEDGNHRVEGLRRSGRSEYWSVVGFESDEARQDFVDRWPRRA